MTHWILRSGAFSNDTVCWLLFKLPKEHTVSDRDLGFFFVFLRIFRKDLVWCTIRELNTQIVLSVSECALSVLTKAATHYTKLFRMTHNLTIRIMSAHTHTQQSHCLLWARFTPKGLCGWECKCEGAIPSREHVWSRTVTHINLFSGSWNMFNVGTTCLLLLWVVYGLGNMG